MKHIVLSDDQELFPSGLKVTPQQIKIAERYASFMKAKDGTFGHYFLVGALSYIQAAIATGELPLTGGFTRVDHGLLRTALIRAQRPLTQALQAMDKIYKAEEPDAGANLTYEDLIKDEELSALLSELSAPKKKPATKKTKAKPAASRDKAERIKKKKERIKSLQERINSHEGAPAKLQDMRRQLKNAVTQLQNMQRAQTASISLDELR